MLTPIQLLALQTQKGPEWKPVHKLVPWPTSAAAHDSLYWFTSLHYRCRAFPYPVLSSLATGRPKAGKPFRPATDLTIYNHPLFILPYFGGYVQSAFPFFSNLPFSILFMKSNHLNSRVYSSRQLHWVGLSCSLFHPTASLLIILLNVSSRIHSTFFSPTLSPPSLCTIPHRTNNYPVIQPPLRFQTQCSAPHHTHGLLYLMVRACAQLVRNFLV